MFHSKITVTLRTSILDPQGKAVEHGIHSLGMTNIEHVRIGKFIEFDVNTEAKEEAERVTMEACRKLLANPVMEDFTFTLEKIQKPVHA
ncbi:MAG: phosphoribosylformylglycinamidine synthase subunit PurS [Ignavibacteriales bacterium]|nr:phosphoribosylformylglycinamidine synthase subunit PurS [Ignavibacteriales bacterium]